MTLRSNLRSVFNEVVGDIAKDVERVYGKERLLVDIATASIDDPGGRICDVIFPVVGKEKLAAIVKESNAKGALDRRFYAVMRNSWANHYRRMLPSLLSVLEFRSNNAVWRPVLSALDWIKAKLDDGCRFVPQKDVPIDGVIPAKWRSSVIDGNGRVNRISYELCVLTQLRECIRSKEIWVFGANRYRNPDDDLPKDFAARRSSYYSRLNLTQNAREFVAMVRQEMEHELLLPNEGIGTGPASPSSLARLCEHPHASNGTGRTSLARPHDQEDHRGLTPLIYAHVNPYGRFDLNL